MTSAGSPSATSWPLCRTMMRSASSRTTSILCSTSRIVLSRARLSSRIRSRITGTSSTLMPAVGSSNMYTLGSSAISIATSSFLWSPCGRLLAGASTRSPRRTCSTSARARSSASLRSSQTENRLRPSWRFDCTASLTFSSTLRFGNSCVSWNARPRPRWVRAGTVSPVMSAPSSQTEPAMARSWPEIRLKYVVLPAPFGPTIAVRVPGAKAQETRSTATWPPKRIVSSLVSSMATPCGAARDRSALVLDRDVHLFRLDLVDQLGDAPLERRIVLDPEVIHRLHRLVVFLAEGHLALGRLEAHAFHGLDELLGVGVAAGFLQCLDDRNPRTHAASRE